MKWLLHGTNYPEKILQEGFSMEAARRSDPGDFGWGIYLTNQKARAASYGTILQVHVDTSKMAFIKNPYFLNPDGSLAPRATQEEKLFYEQVFPHGEDWMNTVLARGDERVANCKRVRELFMGHGYTGIKTAWMDQETVVFDLNVIQEVKALPVGRKVARFPEWVRRTRASGPLLA